ncbi:MAG TPA: phage major capsid protein, partial [Urbifossiella sp.]|nr:phage major capsid protein [Urbifossiella sp.]
MEPKQYTPEEIAKRISEVAPEKRNAELVTIAEEMGLKHERNADGVAVELSDAQFERLFTGFQTEAQKVVTEVAGQAERKYDLTRGDALAAAESVVGKALQKRALKRKEDEIIARRLASIVKTRAGFAKPGEYDQALDEEVRFVRDHYGVEHRAMTLGDDTTGGYLAGEVFDTRVYENLKRTSVARRFCTLMEMSGVELKRFPKLTQGLTASGKTETGAGSTSQVTLSQFTLQPKQLMVLSAPFSLALLEAADPNLIDLLTKQATIAFGRAEDAALWNGNSDVGITGIMSTTTNNVTMGAGKTAVTDLAFEDLFDMENELDEQYTPDEETQGSGGIDGQAFYYFNKNAYNALRKLKGQDQ